MRNLPPEFPLDQTYRCRGRRRPGCEDFYSGPAVLTNLFRGVRYSNEDRRRGTQPRDGFVVDQIKDRPGINPSQTNVSSADGRDDPYKSPAVGMEHRKRPQISV